MHKGTAQGEQHHCGEKPTSGAKAPDNGTLIGTTEVVPFPVYRSPNAEHPHDSFGETSSRRQDIPGFSTARQKRS